MQQVPEKSMEEVIKTDGRYPLEAFAFLHESLNRAVKQTHGDPEAGLLQQRHVSGQDLCLALRDQAIGKWGMLAKTVLNKWNIHSTMDFGNMVYLLVDNKFMRKTEEDSIEHFRDVYNFDETFNIKQKFDIKE